MPRVTRSSPRDSSDNLKSNWTAVRRRMLVERFRTVPYPNWLGIKVGRLGAGDSLLALRIQKRHHQYQGIVHGGVLASLADTAATFSALTIVPDATDVVTIEFKVNFLAAMPAGTLRAHGQIVRMGSRVAVSEVRVYGPKERLVMTGTFTMLVFAK